ncbi:unnamed protein product [Protopolystoma xenopodis]|uniref:guanylate cyclase n=1 Tax=Protopolystoma xenopodis TaxID=117903 RepID=A0A448WDS5_9PLAT|nr:unnamed protein product [Protopolystoma xenopodis]
MVKDLSCDHICRLIGVCVDRPHLVYEYCPKGSLQDVLESEQINLDWMFKFSLIQDICRGMIYLHNNLGPHGNLKSSNCLVDSRFVVKITDFGLHILRGPKYTVEDYAFHRSKFACFTYFIEAIYTHNLTYRLWTSPELLRDKVSSALGTIKGDVYSFAIVCQEIIYRKGVFFLATQELEPKVNSK